MRNVSPRSHIGNAELSSLSWLTFPRRINFFSLVHAYKVKHGLSPSYLASNFECVQDVHRHNLRQSSVNFSLAHCSSPPGSFVRNTVTNWNSLPANVKGCRSLSNFKSTLKDYLHGIQKCISSSLCCFYLSLNAFIISSYSLLCGPQCKQILGFF